MEIINIPIEKIIPYKKNPRKNEKSIPKVVESLREFGFRQPLVVDKNMVLLVGHTRLMAAKELGFKEVPVHVAKDLNAAQAKAYRIKDNRAGERSEWDRDLLLQEIDELLAIDVKFDADFLDFEIETIDEKAEYKTYDLDSVMDEFVLTIKGPLTSQDEVRKALKKFEDKGFNVEVSHVKRTKK